MTRVLYYEILRFQPENLALLQQRFDVRRVSSPDEDNPQLLGDINVVFAPLGYYWGKEKIEHATALKVIASNTSATSHIDVEYAEKKGIKVITLKEQTRFLSHITPTAELTWGLILGVVRKIPWAFQSVIEGCWDRRLFGGKAMLSRMAIGIVGLGRLGTIVARQALAFGMTVRFYDRSAVSFHEGVEAVPSLEALLAQSDIVTVHIPLEQGNKRLFDDRLFSYFKDGAYFINTSRGEVIDPMALLRALERGKLAGAAVDVLDGEFERGFQGRVQRHPLVDYSRMHNNLIITPHIGGSTIDAWRETEGYTIEMVLQALEDWHGPL